MKEKIMDIIWEDQLFEVDATLSQQTDEIDGLAEVEVLIRHELLLIQFRFKKLQNPLVLIHPT